MTLCGVLKDILLVAASILIWGTPISALQYFGYGLALCGLVYYKLGAATIKAQFCFAGDSSLSSHAKTVLFGLCASPSVSFAQLNT